MAGNSFKRTSSCPRVNSSPLGPSVLWPIVGRLPQVRPGENDIVAVHLHSGVFRADVSTRRRFTTRRSVEEVVVGRRQLPLALVGRWKARTDLRLAGARRDPKHNGVPEKSDSIHPQQNEGDSSRNSQQTPIVI